MVAQRTVAVAVMGEQLVAVWALAVWAMAALASGLPVAQMGCRRVAGRLSALRVRQT